VFAYEGIGIILPVMEMTAEPENYFKVVFAVITTVLVVCLTFGELCYIVYGTLLENQPIILNMLPFTPTYNNVITALIKVIFCINLVFSYPLVIYPANLIIESYLFGSME
jgi:proton-coupled amino acid transporter